MIHQAHATEVVGPSAREILTVRIASATGHRPGFTYDGFVALLDAGFGQPPLEGYGPCVVQAMPLARPKLY